MSSCVACISRDVVHHEERGRLSLEGKLCIGLLLGLFPLSFFFGGKLLWCLLLFLLLANGHEVDGAIVVIVVHDTLLT